MFFFFFLLNYKFDNVLPDCGLLEANMDCNDTDGRLADVVDESIGVSQR